MKTCNNCGALLEDSANFCNMCGNSEFTPVPEEAPVVQEPIPEESAEPIPEESEPAPEAEAEPEAPQEPESEPKIPQDTYYSDGGVPVPPAPPKKKLSKGAIICICGGAAALVVILVLVLVLTNPVRRFMNCIKEGDSPAAAEIYYSSIINSDSRVQKAADKLTSYIDEQMQLYLDGEISYDELTASLWAIDATSVYNENTYAALQEAAYVNDCRETYQSAEEAFADGDYGMAVVLYGQVAGAEFEHGDDATARLAESTPLYREQILEEVEQYISNNAYTSAQALLSEAFGILPNDAALLDAYERCTQAEYDYGIACLIEEAEVYMSSNDFTGAIAFLDEQIGLYPEEILLLDARDDCLTRFEAYVIEESFRLASGGDYTHAASLAASGLEYFTSSKVTELHQIYVSHIPVLLGDMEIFKNDTEGGTWSTNTNKTDQYFEDKFGGTYTHSFTVGCGSVTYYVNFKYQTFTGTVAFPKSLTADSYRQSATLTIYGDGQEIAVYRDITDTTKPQAFSLDIAGYEQITLTWTCDGSNIWKDWGDYATIFDGVLTPIPLALPESVS